jgi:class 3 adenylate cyclase
LYEWLSRRHQLVRFDERGRGLLQRDAARTTETIVADLDAVAAALELDTFDLFGHGSNAAAGVIYAAQRPERVRRLIWVDGVPPLPETAELPESRVLRAIVDIDWGLYNEILAAMIWGFQGGQRSRQLAALAMASQTHVQRVQSGERTTSSSTEQFLSCLPLIKAPTLIVTHNDGMFQSPAANQRLAAGLADARLVFLEGDALSGSFNDPLMMAAIDEFLGDSTQGGRAGAGLPAGTAVIMFVDIENSTAQTERMGDAAFREGARVLDERVRAAVRSAGGNVIEGKVMGDGVMSVFGSAAQAIAGARACRELSAESELRLHIGLHAGDVIREANNVYGGAVNIAARMCDASTAGEILVSATVRDLARTSAGVTFEDRGERAFKGIQESIRVFAVGD